MQDLGGRQDHHAEKDPEDSRRGSGQAVPAFRCPLDRSFWDDTHNGTAAEKRQFVISQLTVATVRCRITTLDLSCCGMQGKDSERFAEVLFTNVTHYPRDREACTSADAVHSAGSPQSQLQ